MKALSVLTILILSLNVQAKTLHYYNAEIHAQTINPVKPGFFQSHLKGWDCRAEAHSKIVESQANHKGELKAVTWSGKSSSENSTESKDSLQFQSDLIVNQDHVNPKLQARLEEVCTKDWTRIVPDDPSTKEDESRTVTETATLTMKWDCDVNGETMPTSIGQKKEYKCHQGGWNVSNAESVRDVEKYAKTRDKRIEIDLKLAKVTQENIDYFDSCKGRPDSDAVIINLSQGVAGHIGENDFVFYVSLDGGKKLKISRATGLLSDDIKYCPPDKKGNINVDIKAVEEDFPAALNDNYRSQDINVSSQSGSGSISLDRKVLGMKAYKSSIAVKIKPYQAPTPVAQFDNLPKSSGASADWAK